MGGGNWQLAVDTGGLSVLGMDAAGMDVGCCSTDVRYFQRIRVLLNGYWVLLNVLNVPIRWMLHRSSSLLRGCPGHRSHAPPAPVVPLTIVPLLLLRPALVVPPVIHGSPKDRTQARLVGPILLVPENGGNDNVMVVGGRW